MDGKVFGVKIGVFILSSEFFVSEIPNFVVLRCGEDHQGWIDSGVNTEQSFC